MITHTEKIRELNDKLRRNLDTGLAVITPGVAALGAEAVKKIVQTIAVFDDFSRERPASGTRLWVVRSARGDDLFQDRLLRLDHCRWGRRTRVTRWLRSASSPSCSPRNIRGHRCRTFRQSLAASRRSRAGRSADLMEPMGWAGQQVARLAGGEPAALAGFLSLSKARMHVIAFVLAHADGRPLCAARRPVPAAARRASGKARDRARAEGSHQATSRPGASPSGYRLILELMADADTVRLSLRP